MDFVGNTNFFGLVFSSFLRLMKDDHLHWNGVPTSKKALKRMQFQGDFKAESLFGDAIHLQWGICSH